MSHPDDTSQDEPTGYDAIKHAVSSSLHEPDALAIELIATAVVCSLRSEGYEIVKTQDWEAWIGSFLEQLRAGGPNPQPPNTAYRDEFNRTEGQDLGPAWSGFKDLPHAEPNPVPRHVLIQDGWAGGGMRDPRISKLTPNGVEFTNPDVVAVHLPEPDENGEWENQPEWWVGTGTVPGWVVPHTGRIRLRPASARAFAAALLAAANAVDAADGAR
jgi:hypothetical protein